MRVLHVLSAIDPQYGGPSYALLGLVLAQRLNGIDARITATRYWDLPKWPEYDRLVQDGCPINVFHYRPRAVGKIRPFKEQLCKDIQDADIVHIHSLWHTEQRIAAKLALQFGKPYLFRPCGMLAPWSMSQSRWKKQLYLHLRLKRYLQSAARIHFTTNRESRTSLRVSGMPLSIVEPNGINRSDFDSLPEPGTFRTSQGIPPQTPIALFLGRIHHKKGIELLLAAFEKIADAVLVVAGPDNDNQSAKLKLLAKELGMSDRVRFTGSLHGVSRLAAFQDANVFVLPSYHENFGNTVIESLACGTPVIISDQVDLCEDLVDPDVCTVVPLDVQTISTTIQQELARPKSEARSRRCREIAFDQFDWTMIGKRWLGHYATILSE